MGDQGYDCQMTIDCTDCYLSNVAHSMAAFNSYKFKRSGLRYEIGLCIKTGWICWVFGGLPCGDWVDVDIFRLALKHELDEHDRVEADDGYVGEDPVKTKVPASMVHPQDKKILRVRSKVRRRHETVNKTLKTFLVLGGKAMRHDLECHGYFFRAVVVLVQLSMQHGKPLFQVPEYHDPPPPAPPLPLGDYEE